MKIIFICTNYNSIKCGIGMFTYNLVSQLKKKKDLDIEVISKNTFHIRGIKKLFSLDMSKEIFKFISKNKGNILEKRKFIIEYPFMDWSLFTIISLVYLKYIFKSSNIILSIHEYSRVNIIRRIITDFLIKISDGYIITEEELFSKINGNNKIKRSIPSNIIKIKEDNIKRDRDKYCYFGLINKAKAFEEMIEGWKSFNICNKKILNIYTSSEIYIENADKYNIKIYKNLNNIELSKELQKNTYMLLPIIPKIDLNNGTLKAAAEHGCIPIGIFSEKLNSLGIKINSNNYTDENIKVALEKSINMDNSMLIKNLFEYSKKFSFEQNAEDIYRILISKEWRKI